MKSLPSSPRACQWTGGRGLEDPSVPAVSSGPAPRTRTGGRQWAQLGVVVCLTGLLGQVAPAAHLSVPPTRIPVPLAIPTKAKVGKPLALVDVRHPETAVLVDVVPRPDAQGLVAAGDRDLVGTLPARRGRPQPRVLELREAPESELARPSRFRFSSLNDDSLLLWEGAERVLVYNHGMRLPEGVPADRRRSSYVHPVYGLDGEVLTDDFPKDHYHHRGLFWAWPHVRTEGQHYDLWMISGVEQRFGRWLVRDESAAAATLAVENGWYVGDRQVMRERIWLRVYPAGAESRCIDVDCYWIPVDEAVELAGAAGKSYGGLTLR